MDKKRCQGTSQHPPDEARRYQEHPFALAFRSSTDPPVLVHPSIQTFRLRDIEDLREASRGADLTIVQLACGTFHGRLMHAQIGTLFLSAGDFGPDIRARGVMNQNLVTLGMMVASSGQVSQWDYEVLPGDVVVFPRSVEQEGRFTEQSSYVTITLTEEELAAHAPREAALQDPRFWTRIHRFRRPADARQQTCRALFENIQQLRNERLPQTEGGIDFLRRVLIESFLTCIIDEIADRYDEHHHRNAKLVRDVEDYVDAIGTERAIHISELCSALTVSRRTMHRAFYSAMGIGPIAYLRARRLSAISRVICSGKPLPASITQVALEYGFADLGRFAGYYRRLFAETPSQTRLRYCLEQTTAASPRR